MSGLSPDWRKILVDILLRTGIIPHKWTGRLTISVNDGGIAYIEKVETVK